MDWLFFSAPPPGTRRSCYLRGTWEGLAACCGQRAVFSSAFLSCIFHLHCVFLIFWKTQLTFSSNFSAAFPQRYPLYPKLLKTLCPLLLFPALCSSSLENVNTVCCAVFCSLKHLSSPGVFVAVVGIYNIWISFIHRLSINA